MSTASLRTREHEVRKRRGLLIALAPIQREQNRRLAFPAPHAEIPICVGLRPSGNLHWRLPAKASFRASVVFRTSLVHNQRPATYLLAVELCDDLAGIITGYFDKSKTTHSP